MAGSISILGLGSDALNADTIDKLKEADKEMLLKPVNKRADKNVQQREDLQKLMEGMKSLEKASGVFADEISYLQRTTSYTGSGGTVTAEDGINPMSGRIEVQQLAQKNVLQSKGFESKDSIISGLGGETVTIGIDGKEYEIDITGGMSLEDLRQSIVDRTDGAVEASILDVGGDKPFSLVLKSKEEGMDNAITVTASDPEFDLGMTEIQSAQDAKFTYNGISISRSSNSVDDLIYGVKIELQEADEVINFQVKQDLEGMSDKFAEFVKVYNENVALLDELTDYDAESGTAASFQGDSRVTSIRTALSGILFKTMGEESLTQYGLEVSKEGQLVFDQAAFESKMASDPTAFENLMRGETKITEAITISNKVGYTSEQVNEIQPDGSVKTTTQYVPLAEDKTIAAGSVKINGVSLPEVNLLASNSPQLNTQELIKAINSIAGETGVSASVSGSGDKVILTNASGGEISISDATPDAVKLLGLSNGTATGRTEDTEGIFSQIDDYFERTIVGELSSLGLLESSLKSETDRLDEEISRTMERINDKYAIMEAQFASYNSIIQQFESNFQALQMQIDTAIAAKK